MEPFETTLTGSDGQINGIVTPVKFPGSKQAYQFVSLDDALHLTIALEANNVWIRIGGTTPYFPGWVEELAEKALDHINNIKPVAVPSLKPSGAAKTTQKVTPVKAESAVIIKTTKNEPKKAAPATAKSNPTVKKTAVKVDAAKKTKPAVAVSKKGKVTSAATKK